MDAQETPVAAVEAAHALRVLVGRLRRRMQDESAVGALTSAQASALARVAVNEPTSTGALAGAERIRPQSMATTVAALEQLGLLRREDDPSDGRRQLLFLTPEGREYAQGARTTREEWLSRTLAERLSEDELTVVTESLALLTRLVES
jgi:DNA-binding MarR family transcriptional regulator